MYMFYITFHKVTQAFNLQVFYRELGVKWSQEERGTEMGAFLWRASPNGICTISDLVSSCEQTCRWQEAEC